jgi:hypothetical protein
MERFHNYKYTVKIQNKEIITYSQSKYPRVRIKPHKRDYYCYYQSNDKIKYILYPRKLWFTEVYENDYVENTLMSINDIYPEWDSITLSEK